MIPNNNLSVLPFYKSIDEQNARKWWVYGRVYPLYARAQYLPPFQIIRQQRDNYISGWPPLGVTDTFSGALRSDGSIDSTKIQCTINTYVVPADTGALFINSLPGVPEGGYVSVQVFINDEGGPGDFLMTYTPVYTEDGVYSGPVELPGDEEYYVRVQVGNTNVGPSPAQVFPGTDNGDPRQVFLLTVVSEETGENFTEFVGSINNPIPGVDVKRFAVPGCDVIVSDGSLELGDWYMPNGRYYIRVFDGTDIWYSDVFTVVNDLEPYLKIEWWDDEDFVMPAGAIVYDEPAFRNVLYLASDIAKPEYKFDEEGETRDGYFFPTKMVSQKVFRFAFLAPEYLLDVLRLVRMADHIEITKAGQVYEADSFLISPEWEDNGDLAAVSAEFETRTVAKKIGHFAI